MRAALRTATTLASLLAITACGSVSAPPDTRTARYERRAERVWSADGVDPAAMDPSVDACSDFYQHSCGGWLARTSLPPDADMWLRSFSVLDRANEERLRTLLEDDAAGRVTGAIARRLGDFYAACMDEEAVERADVRPLASLFAEIAALGDQRSFARALGGLHLRGVGVFFSVRVAPDPKDASRELLVIGRPGLGMPDRDYYVSRDPHLTELRARYESHVARMLALLGEPSPSGLKHVFEIDRRLAEASLTATQRRDPLATYNKLGPLELSKLAPHVDWAEYFRSLGLPDVQHVDVEEPGALRALDQLLVEKVDVVLYAKLRLVERLVAYLPRRFVDEAMTMETAFRGRRELPARWKRCVEDTQAALRDDVARSFVGAILGDRDKATAQQMVRAVEQAMDRDLGALGWMDDDSRTAARQKLANMTSAVGYPDHWRSYDALTITRAEYLANGLGASMLEARRRLAHADGPVDRADWNANPVAVDAFYDARNEMVFPAGIFQPPFYSSKAKSWISFGGIGFVMGHELVHGFDDRGRRFDADGNLRDWWSKSSSDAFERRSSCLERQLDGVTVLDGQHLNGKLTLGESLADLGGIKLAYQAMEATTAGMVSSSSEPTKEQEFFVSFAQTMCAIVPEAKQRMQLLRDGHAPVRFRVNGPLSNLPAFADAFGCKEGSPMARPASERCEVW